MLRAGFRLLRTLMRHGLRRLRSTHDDAAGAAAVVAGIAAVAACLLLVLLIGLCWPSPWAT